MTRASARVKPLREQWAASVRNHKLTQLLQDAIGGGAKAVKNHRGTETLCLLDSCIWGVPMGRLMTVMPARERDTLLLRSVAQALMYVNCSPAHSTIRETANALKLANRAKSIVAMVQAQSPQLSAWEILPLTREQLQCRSIRVTNLIRGLRARDLEEVFSSQVGPVEKCTVSEGEALIAFGETKHAFSAVQKYDGSVLEVSDKDPGARSVMLIPIPWHSSGSALRQLFAEFVHRLEECHYRRGDRWLTLAEVQKARRSCHRSPRWVPGGAQVKGGNNRVECKGSIIKAGPRPLCEVPDAMLMPCHGKQVALQDPNSDD
eukprot:Skav218126  [mRNA]  locus=scaffold759:298288:304652:- [translate_table: standard]